jgi:hypothetical protein
MATSRSRWSAGKRIAYLHLWPHARPWQLKRPQPLLRALPDAARGHAAGQAWRARAAGQGAEAPRAVAAATVAPTSANGGPVATAGQRGLKAPSP